VGDDREMKEGAQTASLVHMTMYSMSGQSVRALHIFNPGVVVGKDVVIINHHKIYQKFE
jgi:hypothetical protein